MCVWWLFRVGVTRSQNSIGNRRQAVKSTPALVDHMAGVWPSERNAVRSAEAGPRIPGGQGGRRQVVPPFPGADEERAV